MATIGSLAVNIVATTDKFKKGLDSAKSSLGKFVSSIGTAQTAVAGLAIAGLSAIVDSAIEAGGKLQELTTKLHISSEALTALHYAADQMESSAGAVDSAIQKMTLTLGKATEGSDKAIGAFNQIHVDFTKILALPVEQQFLAIVDAIHKIPGAAQQAAAAQAIFGKGAKEIMPLIVAGSDAITEYGQKAADAGAIVGTDTVQALDDAGDAVNRFKASWEALKLNVVGVAAPLIGKAMDYIVTAIKVVKTAWYSLQYAIIGGIELIAKAVLKLEESLSHVPLIGKTMGDWAQKDQYLVNDLTKSREDIGNKISTTWGGGDNPLTKSGANVSGTSATGKDVRASTKATEAQQKQWQKEDDANQKLVQEQLKELVKATKENRPPNIQLAGVR